MGPARSYPPTQGRASDVWRITCQRGRVRGQNRRTSGDISEIAIVGFSPSRSRRSAIQMYLLRLGTLFFIFIV